MKQQMIVMILSVLLSACAMAGNRDDMKNKAGIKEISWTQDHTLQDDWTPRQDLRELEAAGLSVSDKDAQPVRVLLEEVSKEERAENYSAGGVSVKYAQAELPEEEREQLSPEAADTIDALLARINEEAAERAAREMEEGWARWAAYAGTTGKENPYIYLTTWISPQLARCDTQIISMITETYRYNRDFEPDFYEVHGLTIDTQTGRELSLNDFFTDTSGLADLVTVSLRERYRYLENELSGERGEAMSALIRQGLEGCRDDGSLAWAVWPDGMEFRLVSQSLTEVAGIGHTHTEMTAFVPFASCRELLRTGVTDTEYDYIVRRQEHELQAFFGAPMPTREDGSSYGAGYAAVAGGQKYLYVPEDERTFVFTLDEESSILVPAGSVIGEIKEKNGSGRCSVMMDPQEISLSCVVELVQELFLETTAHTGEEGELVCNDLFYLRTTPLPMYVGKEFEAELVPDGGKCTIASGSAVIPLRTDAETFIDAQVYNYERGDYDTVRLYIEGDEENGWIINGHPMEEIFSYIGWLEE